MTCNQYAYLSSSINEVEYIKRYVYGNVKSKNIKLCGWSNRSHNM